MKLYIKKPQGRRKSYAIYKREIQPNDKTKNQTIHSAELDALNASTLAPDIKYKNVMELKKRLERDLGIDAGVTVHNEDNERILNQYWEKKYKRRELVDKKTARYEYERAIKALGNVSLVIGKPDEIETAVASHGFGKNKRRRILGKIKLLVSFLKRDIEINIPGEERNPVRYMTEKEFNKKLSKVDDDHLRALFDVLFYTGMRLGEALAITELKLKKKSETIVVDTQLDKDNECRLPKCGKTRKTFVPRKAFPKLQRWIELKGTFYYKRSLINKRFKKWFGNELTVHDLRHCYAIGLLSKGVPMAHVAQSLGNSVKVCEKYYTGFELVDESIETIRRIMKTG